MDPHQHAFHLGSLLANLQSLEFILRAYFASLQNAATIGLPHGVDVYTVPVGGTLPESPFTNYDTLGQLIAKYNELARQQDRQELDTSLVEVRDALAHGRISAAATEETLRLIKFSKPKNGIVCVTFNSVMDDAWFANQKRRVRDSMMIVAANVTPFVKVVGA